MKEILLITVGLLLTAAAALMVLAGTPDIPLDGGPKVAETVAIQVDQADQVNALAAQLGEDGK